MSSDPSEPPGGDASDADKTVVSDAGRSRPWQPVDARTRAGTIIGRYRVVEKIGEGGMGVVFAADQDKPRRRVALKLIRGGRLADDLSVRLFEREAEMLGRLDHPAIAAIYEAGQTDDGQSFLALELVQGSTFDAYVRTHHAGGGRDALQARLRLFLEVCDAVQYAHQRGVIHRDLKPSNILVAAGDDPAAAPRIKILDFGLAKLAGPADAGAEGLSRVGTVRGTLAYMSPEQVGGDSNAIDIRTDVYSLGVILYQMISGELPYDVGSASLFDAARTITETRPRPLDSSGRASAVDADLRTIVAKALEKSPDARYASAAALRDDVERYLADQPILARPPSTSYQLRKLIARNRAAFVASLAAVATLLAFGVLMTLLYRRSEQNLARALEAERKAATEAATAQQVSGFLTDLFEVSNPDEARGKQVTARELLDQGAARIRTQLTDRPEVQGRLMRSMGVVYSKLGLYHDAQALLSESVDRSEALDRAAALADLATAESRLGNHENALRAVEESLRIEEPTLPADSYAVLSNRIRKATVLNRLGKYEQAKALFEATLPELERILPPDSRDLAAARMSYGNLLGDLGRHKDALAAYEQSLAAMEKVLPPDHPQIADLVLNVATCHDLLGDLPKAKELQIRAVAIREKTLGPDHPRTLEGRENLAIAYSKGGDPASAIGVFQENVRRWERTLGPDHPNVAQTLSNLGYTYFLMEQYPQARETLERALRIREMKLAPDDLDANLTRYNLANTYMALRRYADARQLFGRVIDVDTKHMGENTEEVLEDYQSYLELLEKSGDAREAAAVRKKVGAIQAALKSEPAQAAQAQAGE